MSKKSKTSYFTKRGNYFGNLWATYSTKAGRVLLLGSDRQLAHWLLKLEFSPSIENFNFQPGSKAVGASSPLGFVDYHVEVQPVRGPIELHFLRASGFSDNYVEKSSAAESMNYKYIEYNDEHWIADKFKVFSLLRVTSFLSGGRHLYVPVGLIEESKQYICLTKQGNLRAFLSAVHVYDRNLCLLVFCRMYSAGIIDVSFEDNFFSLNTWWWLNEE
jgi:hypothetical protein